MDADSNKGVVVGHACGEVDANVCVPFAAVFAFAHSSHSCPKLSYPLVPTKSLLFLHLLSK